MDFGFSEEQELLRAELRKFLDEHCPIAEVRKHRRVARGLLAGALEAHRRARLARAHDPRGVRRRGPRLRGLGGAARGDGPRAVPLAARLLGARGRRDRAAGSDRAARALAAAPRGRQRDRDASALLEASDQLAPEGVAARGRPRRRRLRARGREALRRATRARRTSSSSPSGAATRRRRLASPSSSAARPASRAEDLPGIDLTKRSGRLRLDGVRVPRGALLGAPGAAWPAIARLLDLGAFAAAAEAIGAAEAALALTVSLRAAARPVRLADRTLPGREAPARRDVRRRRVVEVAGLLRRLGARRDAPGRAARGVAGEGLRERGASRASASTACSSTAASATPGSTTRSSS